MFITPSDAKLAVRVVPLSLNYLEIIDDSLCKIGVWLNDWMNSL